MTVIGKYLSVDNRKEPTPQLTRLLHTKKLPPAKKIQYDHPYHER